MIKCLNRVAECGLACAGVESHTPVVPDHFLVPGHIFCAGILYSVLLVQVAWHKGGEVQQVWQSVVALLGYPHAWVRKATGRLLGLLLASPKLGTTFP